MISTKTARRKAFQQGQKDFHAGWTEEHNPYQMGMYKRAWRKGFKREKGKAWLAMATGEQKCGLHPGPCGTGRSLALVTFTKPDPDAHLGGVAA